MQNQEINVGFSPIKNTSYIANISIGDDYVVFKKLPRLNVDFENDGENVRSIIRDKTGKVYDIELMSDFSELQDHVVSKIQSIVKALI